MLDTKINQNLLKREREIRQYKEEEEARQ